jgi:hypothetical protein
MSNCNREKEPAKSSDFYKESSLTTFDTWPMVGYTSLSILSKESLANRSFPSFTPDSDETFAEDVTP